MSEVVTRYSLLRRRRTSLPWLGKPPTLNRRPPHLNQLGDGNYHTYTYRLCIATPPKVIVGCFVSQSVSDLFLLSRKAESFSFFFQKEVIHDVPHRLGRRRMGMTSFSDQPWQFGKAGCYLLTALDIFNQLYRIGTFHYSSSFFFFFLRRWRRAAHQDGPWLAYFLVKGKIHELCSIYTDNLK